MFNSMSLCYTLIPSTYCQHGGIDVISSIVGGSSSKCQVVSGVCFGDVKLYTVCYSYCFPIYNSFTAK